MMQGRARIMGAAVVALAVILGLGILAGPAFVERELNVVAPHDPWFVSTDAAALHQQMLIADLHADTFLWDRDPRQRADRGHVDLVRLREGNVAVQVFAVVTKSPSGQNYDANTAGSDNITPLVMLQGWPVATWDSLGERALYQATRLRELARSDPDLIRLLLTGPDVESLLGARAQGSEIIGGLLALEGAHALDGDLGMIAVLREAGFRMMGLHHFFDNKLGGSLHGISGGGLSEFGREAVREMQRQGILIDLAHSSEAVVREVLAMTTRPPVVSHTGVYSQCPTARNIDDALLARIAVRGGLIGIGFWEGAVCDITPAGVARSIARAIEIVGEDHVALGSDWDGSTTVLFDASELSALTQALLDEGLSEVAIRKVMGENLIEFLATHLPAGETKPPSSGERSEPS